MIKNFKKYFFLVSILIFPTFFIQQCSKKAAHHFKDLGFFIKEDVISQKADTIKVPDFQFINVNSDTIGREYLYGDNYIIQFFFTACPTICPASTYNIKNEIHQKFLNVDDLKILSISIAEDTPTQMIAFANKFKIDSPNWHFLTGNRNDVWMFANQLSLNAGLGSEEEGGFFHSPFLILVDKKGFIRTGIDKQDNTKLVWDATSVSDMQSFAGDLSQFLFNQNKPFKK